MTGECFRCGCHSNDIMLFRVGLTYIDVCPSCYDDLTKLLNKDEEE